MKSLAKPVVFSAILTAIGLSFTVSHAATNQVDSALKVPETKLVLQTWSPVESESGTILKAQMLDVPMLKMLQDELPVQAFQPQEKRNRFFEFATVFDDKLQQLMSFLKSIELFNTAHATTSANLSTDKPVEELKAKRCQS